MRFLLKIDEFFAKIRRNLIFFLAYVVFLLFFVEKNALFGDE